MKSILKILVTTIILLITYYLNCQTTSNFRKGEDAVLTKSKHASDVILKYTDISYFKNGITKQSIDSFKMYFEPSAKIIFDIPFINKSLKSNDFKRISKDDRQQSKIIPVFGKTVSVDMYLDILERNAEEFPMMDLDSTITRTGRIDSIGKNYDTIVIEIEKRFKNTEWSVESRVKYLFYMRKTDYNMNIFKVIVNDENTTESDIKLRLVDGSLESKDEKYYLPGIVTKLLIEFELPINNYQVEDTSNLKGIVSFEKVAGKNSTIYFDTVYDIGGIQYEIPPDLKGTGMKVSEQPEDGFTIRLRPYKWSGFAYSLSFSGGSFSPEVMDLSNFQSGTTFKNGPGYQVGLNFNFTYFFNNIKWKTSPKKWLFGLGSGISIDYLNCKTESSQFSQEKYNYIDIQSDTCQVLITGQDFSEKDNMIKATVPLFVEFKKKLGKKASLSIQTGVNVSIPLSANYSATGSFSRWGYYDELNSQPITDDGVYNYFTNEKIDFSGNIEYNSLLAEGFVKLKTNFNVFKNKPDNSFEIGLVFSVPFTSSTNYSYPQSKIQNYSGYWIDTENNSYHNVAYSRDKIYQYYFGISIGFNFIRYKLQ